MQEIEEWKKRLFEDERNQTYSQRGIYPVFQIHPQAKILLVGQAPGKKVEETQIPFWDASGEQLMDWLGLKPDVFYSKQIAIMPMDFYFPGKSPSGSGDRPPRKFIAREYHAKMRAYMKEIQMTILIGKYATDYYLAEKKKKNLTETVRAYREYLPEYFPIVHPSPLNFRWQKKNPWFLDEVVPELRHRVASILASEERLAFEER